METIECSAVLFLLHDHLRGKIAPRTVELIAEHLRRCVPCSIAYRSAQEAADRMDACAGRA